LRLSNLKDMEKYTIKEICKEIVSPHKKKFINTVSPWMVGSVPEAKEKKINTYYLLLDSNTFNPEGEALLLTFDRDEVQLEIIWDKIYEQTNER
jgi:glutamate formiminotransferase